MTRIARLATLALLLAGCAARPGPSTPAPSVTKEPAPSASPASDAGLSGPVAYVAGMDPQVHLLDLATGESRQLTQLLPEHAELAATGPLSPVLTCGFGVTSLAWSPDGSQLAFNYGGCDTVVYVVDLDGGLTRIGDGRGPAWSPDGHQIVFAPNSPFCMEGGDCGQDRPPGELNLQVADVAGGGAPRPLTLDPSTHMGGQPAFSPDGALIAFTGPIPDPQPDSMAFAATYVMSAEGADPRLIARGAWPQGWLPDGRLLIVEEETGDLFALELDTGDSVRLGGQIAGAAVSPDGTRLLLTEPDPQTGTPRTRVSTLNGDLLTEGEGWPAAWAPDSRAAVVAAPFTPELIVIDRDGNELARLPMAGEIYGGSAAWRPGT